MQRPLRIALGAALLAGAPAPRPAAEPELPAAFAGGLRWTYRAPPEAPWIPAEVALAGDGELVWAAASGAGAARFPLLASGALGTGVLRREAGPLAAAPGAERVAAGESAGALFAGYRAGGRARVARRAPSSGGPGAEGGFDVLWSHDAGAGTDGALFLRGDDAAVVLAVHRPADGVVQVDWLAASSGALAARAEVAGTSLRALAASDGGGRVAVVAGAEVRVLERTGPLVTTLHAEPLPAPTRALSLSGDGTVVAFGRGAALAVLAEGAGGFAQAAELAPLPGEIALDADLSAGGDALAVGWWHASSGRSARLELVDLAAGGPAVRAAWGQSNPAGGPQEYVADVAITRDGARAAAAFWGGGGAEPEAVLLERDRGALLAVDLGGSAFDVALDRDGTRVAVAAKSAHANALADAGAVHLLDTGERDLQVVGSPDLGGTLRLALRREGLQAALVLAGSPGSGLAVPGVEGTLGLGRPWLVLPAAIDPKDPDVASIALALPPLPGLAGAEVACQGLSASPGGAVAFTATDARPALF